VRALVLVLVLAGVRPASAFQIESPVTSGCHEAITVSAARAAGFPDPAAAPRPTEDQRRAMDDLTFTLRDRDVWTMTLLTGVRSNDLRDNEPIDLSRLVHIHNDPEDQPAHCMRKQDHDGSAGDAAAIQSCKDYILNQLADGGMLEETLDLEAVRSVSMYLAFRGRVDVELPRLVYHLGKAIHALEDSYTHAFRDPPTDAVVHVANWIDSIDASDYIVARDGYHHIGALDDCTRSDPRERDRVGRATLSVTRLIAAVADPAPGRRARIEAMLDAAFILKPGCDSTNRYCDAEELDEETSNGCSASGGRTSIGLLLLVLALLCKKGGPTPFLARGVQTALVLLLLTSVASADIRWHFDARVGGALEHAAEATTVGIGADRGRFTASALVEWNPWFSLDTSRARLGAVNAYLTLSRRWYEGPSFSLYSRAEAGTSTILFELVGVDKGSTGLYLGGSLLGVRIPITPCVALTFDPSHFVMPIPQLAGFPFYYRQYRISVGLEVAL
jgi:hypothetical protein